MNALDEELARTLTADRLAAAEAWRRRREARRTRPATTHPEPVVRRRPGLLARLAPWLVSSLHLHAHPAE